MACGLIRRKYQNTYLSKALTQFKNYVFFKILGQPISSYASGDTAKFISAFSNDLNAIEQNYLLGELNLFVEILNYVVTGVVLLVLNVPLGVTLIVSSLIAILVSFRFGGRVVQNETESMAKASDFVAQTKDLLSGFPVIKSFKAEGEANRLFQASNAETERVKERRRLWDAMLASITAICGSVLQFGIFFYGAWLAIRGEIQMGTVLIILNLCNCFTQPIQVVPQYWASRKAALALIEKLARITKENAGRAGKAIPPVLSDAIALDHVGFSYDTDKPVLQDLSVRFEAGKSYALVGPSGSGKSTLLNLLMGASPDYTGSIAIDGQELREVDTDSLYDLMSLIGQNVFLFDDTIRQNITMFRDFPDQAVDLAVKRSGLTNLLAERGEEYRCGENGVELSGGERQRVSIARALLRGTPVLMLDEATASLDNQTAYEVTDAILGLEGLTRIVVTHRLEPGLLERYDEIVVLHAGKIQERGRFQELMEQKGYFYSLYTVSR